MNLIQFDHSIFAIAREPIKPEVGTIRFVKASPSWNARTDVVIRREDPQAVP